MVALLLALALVSPPQSADLPLKAARSALERRKPEEAREHLVRAAEREPGRAEVYTTAIEGLGNDPDERWLWATLGATRLAGDRGRIPTELRGELPALEAMEEWTGQRVSAVAELEEFSERTLKKARRGADLRLAARWGRRVALDLARPNLWLQEELDRRGVSPRLDGSYPWHKDVIPDLERALDGSRGNHGLAIELARVLTGLAAQANFPDLQGPRPRLGDLGQRAGRVLAQQREFLRDEEGEPWTQEDLEWLSRPEGEAFTREHGDFARPGVAISPNGLYRIESECGAETLAGVAATVELHHRRLVNWYGKDPFEGIPGLVRVVKSHAGLEAEGAGFYWVGGFQGGNTTTVRFALGTIEGLGRTITHELTHRFDGAIFPGQPAWLTEGKAVWTAAAYEAPEDEYFLAEHGMPGTMESAYYDGYGSWSKLEKLLKGEPDDYRDNYVAGYALYMFLRSWREDGKEGGRLLFADQLEEYLPALAGLRRDPVGAFEGFFADGVEGRPSGMIEFASLFNRYLAGFYWRDPEPWAGWYAAHAFRVRENPIIRDEPTWTWERQRTEPFFGQDQARLGAELLAVAGREKEALGAYVWALAMDGRSPFAEREAARLAREAGREEAAFALECELASPPPFPALRAENEAPWLKSLPRTTALLERTLEVAQLAREDGAERAAAALEADAERLRCWLGLAPQVPAEAPSAEGSPLDAPGVALAGWEEAPLAGYDKRRIPGLWYVDERSDLHVGRSGPSDSTGIEARARNRHAYARADRWILPGTWSLRTRIQFTTSYVRGAVVLGSDRRDRDVRFGFSAGDLAFAIGEEEEEPSFSDMNWSLVGRFQREGLLPGTKPRGRHVFDARRTAFDLELLVDGPLVKAFIDGKLVGTYATPDGAPLEGYIGFAMGMGAVRIEPPVLQRLDRARLSGQLDAELSGLDLARGAALDFRQLQARPLAGVEPSVNGLLALWLPASEDETEEERQADALRATEKLAKLASRSDVTQPIVLSLPPGLDPAPLVEDFEREPVVLVRTGESPLEGADSGRRWLAFVDPTGRIRQSQTFAVLSPTFSKDLERWIDALRDYGNPDRELPEYRRGASEEEQDD